MKNMARTISFLLLFIFSAETFAKGVDPIAHASGTAEARLMMNALQERVLGKFQSLSVDHQESVFFGLYKMAVKAQNKLEKMDVSKIAARLQKKAERSEETAPALVGDESVAADFVADSLPVEKSSKIEVSSSQVSGVLAASRDALASVGTPVDAKGNFKALTKSAFLDSIRQLDGDGDYSGLGDALQTLFFVILGVLALGALVIVGLSGAAFGVTGVLVAGGVIGLIVLIVLVG